MRFERAERFKRDWKALDSAERELVRNVLPRFNAAADDVAAHDFDQHSWPAALRVHDIAGASGVWSMTFNFSGPDIRATFEWVTIDGVPAIRWRRIGSHGIYRVP